MKTIQSGKARKKRSLLESIQDASPHAMSQLLIERLKKRGKDGNTECESVDREKSSDGKRNEKKGSSEGETRRRCDGPEDSKAVFVPEHRCQHINPGVGDADGSAIVSSKAFYSRRSKRLIVVEESVWRFLRQVKERALGYNLPKLWRQFPTQRQAFAFADKNDPTGEKLKIFSVEIESIGTRRFITSSYPEFYRRYVSVAPQHRHYYEIIREGFPCHLYFDLEYERSANPNHIGPDAVDGLIDLVKEFVDSKIFKKGLGVEAKNSEISVIELDSSTPQKFSRHVIIRLPGAAFASNAHVGAFVGGMCGHIWSKRNEDPRCSSLIVNKCETKLPNADPASDTPSAENASRPKSLETLIIDTGVYTRNRAFRLFLSSKAGKIAVLRSTGRFGTETWAQDQIFMASLVSNVDPSLPLIRCSDIVEGNETHNMTSCVSSRNPITSAIHAQTSHQEYPMMGIFSYSRAPKTFSDCPQHGPSPFPKLEKFILSICASFTDHNHGFIRSWVSLDQNKVILFNIGGNRWCGNMEREHKSNGVFYVVDFEQGVWFQKCYDPDCRKYRSPANSLPEDVLKSCKSALETCLFEPRILEERSQEPNDTDTCNERCNSKISIQGIIKESDWVDDEWEKAAVAAARLVGI